LRSRGLKVWLDKEQIPPGRWFQDVIQSSVGKVGVAAFFLGPKGMGNWQMMELRTFMSACVNKGTPVIPVLLPGVNELPTELRFLKELNYVSFKDSVAEKEALDALV
jgi:hypothetical protein